MSNKNILPKKMPYVDQFTSTEDAVNYIVKTLNSSFQPNQSSDSVSSSVSISQIDGISFIQSFSSGSGAYLADFTFNHNFNSIPSGFLVSDVTCPPIIAGGSVSLFRVSWTTTQITVRIVVDTNTGVGASGSFKILVLR